MGYRSEVVFVAIVPSYELALECVKTFQVKTKLDGKDLEHFDGRLHQDGNNGIGYIYDKFNDFKWYESFPEVTAITNFYTEWIPEFFTGMNKPYAVSYQRIGEEYEDIESDQWNSDCMSFAFYNASNIHRYIETDIPHFEHPQLIEKAS